MGIPVLQGGEDVNCAGMPTGSPAMVTCRFQVGITTTDEERFACAEGVGDEIDDSLHPATSRSATIASKPVKKFLCVASSGGGARSFRRRIRRKQREQAQAVRCVVAKRLGNDGTSRARASGAGGSPANPLAPRPQRTGTLQHPPTNGAATGEAPDDWRVRHFGRGGDGIAALGSLGQRVNGNAHAHRET